jgi:alkylation response protein AidB-like acyl-CoA dehydrogenase
MKAAAFARARVGASIFDLGSTPLIPGFLVRTSCMTNSRNDVDPDRESRLKAAVAAARVVADLARQSAEALDVDGAFPHEDVRSLGDCGLLAAPLPVSLGGAGLGGGRDGAPALARALALIGGGSLPLGRLYEGHVNALTLIAAYGRDEQLAYYADKAREGRLFAVWNTETGPGVRLIEDVGAQGTRYRLEGAKIFASGAGFVAYPLITARTVSGDLLMAVVDARSAPSDLSQWRAHGMRASASGKVDFSDRTITPDAIIGSPDDFHRQPMFSAGAWRFAAVQLGGIGALFDCARAHLVAAGRARDPHQLARMGAAAIAVETARLWVLRACVAAQDSGGDSESTVAYVNLARLAVERAGLDVLELAHRSVGLAGFLWPHPVERISRDLATYLRQPAPDQALSSAAAFIMGLETPIIDVWSNMRTDVSAW